MKFESKYNIGDVIMFEGDGFGIITSITFRYLDFDPLTEYETNNGVHRTFITESQVICKLVEGKV